LGIMKAGTIKGAYLSIKFAGTPTLEDVSIYININDGTTHLIATLDFSEGSPQTIFLTDLDIAVAVNDEIAMEIDTPTWTTNPSNLNFGGYLYVE